MIMSILSLFLAVFGLGFLVFIHELGHYLMARRVGMRVEIFSIGFGSPIYKWERDGCTWQLCWIPFGGYVRIAGMDKEEGDPYLVKDGFFGKTPLDRIKVLFMGPFVNIVFAFLMFCCIWLLGGREKNFSEFTTRIGWVDPNSELYLDGIRPGDAIKGYGKESYKGSKDHLFAPLTEGPQIVVNGISNQAGQKVPFAYTVDVYPHPYHLEKGMVTAGILAPANYVIYTPLMTGISLPKSSPMYGSGLEPGDALVWVDGQKVYGLFQLKAILNERKAFLTLQRDGKIIHRRVPRVPVGELKLSKIYKEEIADWQFEAGLTKSVEADIMAIPYEISPDCTVEKVLPFIDSEIAMNVFKEPSFSEVEFPLEVGDVILAVDGFPVKYAYQLFYQLQNHKVNVIVDRSRVTQGKVSSDLADDEFDKMMEQKELDKIVASIGTGQPLAHLGNLHLLKPVTPKTHKELLASTELLAPTLERLEEQKKVVEKIENPEERARAKALVVAQESQMELGLLGVQDRKVTYNPDPVTQFWFVLADIMNVLTALVTGALNPKWVSGPVGIVQVMQTSWMVSIKEALYWMAWISVNLGVLNLLPVPVLDGGNICMALYEMVTGKQVKVKTMERLIVPFAILLVVFFVYLTFNDLARLLKQFFHIG